MSKFNTKKLDIPQKINLTQWLFSRIGDKDKIVYYSEQGNINYFTLEKETLQTAIYLKELGLKPKDKVIISLNDSYVVPEIFLGCITIGVYPIILNPRLDLKTLKYILQDSNAKILFNEEEIPTDFFDDLSQENLIQITKQQLLLIISNQKQSKYKFIKANKLYYPTHINESAFIQYTSGSTGKPKGVIHSVRGALNSCHNYAEKHLKLSKDDIIYSISKMFFGYGMSNSIIFPLYLGASAILDHRWPQIEHIIANIRNFLPTILFGTPAIYLKLYEIALEENIFHSIKFFISAGAPLSNQLAAKWYVKFNKKIQNGFGATEMCHIFITNTNCEDGNTSVGKIIQGYKLKIINEQGRKSKQNEPGVLFVKGESISLGYLNNDILTKTKFNSGWYRTGDIFTYDKEGNLFFYGREDDLFKVNGRWVVPLEIESYIKKTFKDVEEVFVVPGEDNHKQVWPILFYKPYIYGKFEINSQMVEKLSANFDNYSVPIGCIGITKLPLNDNGKVQRSFLSNLACALLKSASAETMKIDSMLFRMK
jgi:anthranilate-CoA ligase